jgi:hypothetical protein
MTASSDLYDEWVKAHSPLDPKILHAMGFIQFRWNACEFNYRWLLTTVSGRPFFDIWSDTFESRPSDIGKMLNASLKNARRWPEDAKSLVRHAIELYEINGRNRNQLAHFLAGGTKQGVFELRNKKIGDFHEIFRRDPINADLPSVRKIAEDVHAFAKFLADLGNWFSEATYAVLPDRFPPLPEKLPLPDELWKPPQPATSRPHRRPPDT